MGQECILQTLVSFLLYILVYVLFGILPITTTLLQLASPLPSPLKKQKTDYHNLSFQNNRFDFVFPFPFLKCFENLNFLAKSAA